MNIYEKINKVRLDFQNANIKMSGLNSFAGYKYYELQDILPNINKLCKENGLCCITNFEKEIATLTICDIESTERVIFSSPMATANLKGCHDVQNLGAVQTFLKRYLYQNAFEIVESDALNATQGDNTKAIEKVTCPICGKEIKEQVTNKGTIMKPKKILEKYGKCAECVKNEKHATE